MAKKLIEEKHVSALPVTLTADTKYFVRNGLGFDVYLTNSTGTIVAYPLNPSEKLFPITRPAFPVELDQSGNYGYPAARTDSAIAINNATAKMGPVAMLRINRTTEPTYPTNCTCIAGKFKPSVDNFYYIECVYVAGVNGANNVYHYTISQTPTP